MSGSKTVYHVSSSTFPMFDDSARINQFAAAMLDYTSNSVIEQSEYIKSYYNSSRLRNYKGYLKWCEKSGFSNTFGKINSNFYGDAQFDNNQITEAIKHLFNLGENDTFGVYNSKLSFFSEDFYIKYLATQQGLADKFHTDGDLYYTISYPTPTTIRATLEDGTYVEGALPTGSLNTRFIEISYSILRETQEEYYPPVEELPEEPTEPELPPEEEVVTVTETPESGEITNPETPEGGGTEGEEGGEVTPDPEPEPPKPIIITKYVAEYGYYHYKEGSGNTVLDTLIRNNNISASKSFFPPIPIRNEKSWFSGTKATKINDALVYLELFDRQKDKNKAYDDLKKNLAEGMKEGSINDLNYITMFPGVALNSDNPADQRYLFEFFYNLYFNYALKVARPNPSVPRTLYSGSNYLEDFASVCKRGFSSSGYTDGYFTKFNLSCPASNLNLTYSWGHSDYFEQNGQWKPGAKIGDYGVLSGSYIYKYSTSYQVHATDDEGSYLYRYIDTNGDGETDTAVPVYVTRVRHHEVPYTLTFFCHQTSLNRFELIVFVSLTLTNLVYHGKTIDTKSYDSVNSAAVKENVTLSFVSDVGSNSEYSKITLKSIKATGEIDTPFIVPLEESTFNECGFKNQLDISYGSQFLIINCWVKQKKKWYQRGFLGKVIAFVGLAIGVVLTVFGFGWIGIPMIIYFGIICTAIMLELTMKILCMIFGDRIGAKIYSILLTTVKTVLTYVASVCRFIPVIGWAIYGICMAIYFTISAAEYIRLGYSFGTALKNSALETTVAAVGSYLAGAASQIGTSVGNATQGMVNTGASTSSVIGSAIDVTKNAITAGTLAGINAGVQGFGNSLIQGQSFGKALTTGLKQGAIAGATAAVFSGVGDLMGFDMTPKSIDPINVIVQAETQGVGAVIKGAAVDALTGIVKNPNTYGELLNMALEERYYHKMANMENDYQEFNNQLKSVYDALEVLKTSITSTATAEFVCKLQTCLNRTAADFSMDPKLQDPEMFLTMATVTGSDMIKSVLGTPSIFVEDKLTIDGYSPSPLYFTQTDYTMSWDVS